MKIAKLTAALAASVLVLAACGGDDPAATSDETTDATATATATTETETTATEPTGEPTETADTEQPAASGDLTVWIMEPGNEEVQNVVDETAAAFEDANEGVTVDVQYVPWANAHDQFVTAIGGGQVPDVAEMGTTWTAEFAELGGLAPIEGEIGEDYIESLVNSGTVDDTAYGYPWYAGARSLIYRTDVLEDAGVEVPTTWEELMTAAETIASETDTAPIHVAGDYTHMLVPMIWQAGGDVATQSGDTWEPGVDTEAGRAAFQTYVDLGEWSPEGAVQWNSVDVRDAFANGDSAMMVGGGWDLAAILDANPDLEGNVATTILPAGPGDNSDTFAGGSHLVQFAESQNAELGRQFIEFMLEPDNVSTFADTLGFLPGTASGVEASSAAGDELYGPFTEQLVDHSRTYPATAGWGAVEGDKTFTNAIQQVMQGSLSVEEATAQVDQTLADLLNG